MLKLNNVFHDKRAFTLIELMMVVTITGILSTIALPKFNNMIRKANEGKTKGNLGSLRSSINIYHASTEGLFPSDDLSCLIGDYLNDFPSCDVPAYHKPSGIVDNNDNLGVTAILANNTGHWTYWNWNTSDEAKEWGDLWVGCTEEDLNKISWSLN